MNTTDLIAQLARDATPVRPRHIERRLGLAWLAGSVLAALLMLTTGLRDDLAAATGTTMFWVKLALGGVTAALAVAELRLSVRPGVPRTRALGGMGLLALGLVALAVFELAALPPAQWRTAWLGSSWQVCSALVAGIALPVTAMLFLTARAMAPTDLRRTGALIGLLAGGTSAALYSLHCPETGAAFVLTWYGAGIALATMFGAVLGPRVLRW